MGRLVGAGLLGRGPQAFAHFHGVVASVPSGAMMKITFQQACVPVILRVAGNYADPGYYGNRGRVDILGWRVFRGHAGYWLRYTPRSGPYEIMRIAWCRTGGLVEVNAEW